MSQRSSSKKSSSGASSRGSSRASSRDRAATTRDRAGGRDREVVAIASVVVGVLIALALWFDLAGPLGRGLSTFLGWFVGRGRFALPVVLIAAGVLLWRQSGQRRPRNDIGAGVVVVVLLALVDLIWRPAEPTSPSALVDSGGAIGALVGEPLASLAGVAGAVLILLAAGVVATSLAIDMPLRTMVRAGVRGSVIVVRPIGRWGRRAVSDLATLRSERDEHDGDDRVIDTDTTTATPAERSVGGDPLVAPQLYDFAADDDPPPAPASKKPARRSKPARATPAPDAAPVAPGSWSLPPLALLEQVGAQAVDMRSVTERGETLQESLAQHGVETQLVGSTVGPTVTRYELELGPGVKVARVTSLQKDIAYAMAATDVRILAPIPGRSAIGVEVPNSRRQLVALGDLLASPEAASAQHPLEVAIGKDIAGRAVFLNLATTPHLLIAGATGAGKSSGINCIITSLLMRTTPDQVRLILIDPKQVEMGQYQRLPHLLTQPVTDPRKAANALGWAVKEMERRYDLLSALGTRDIGGYNKRVTAPGFEPPAGRDADEFEHMPFIVVVVDELNDLMMVAARDVEESITRIAQKARAVGIHLIVATQRPSVNVITGVIKANVPARMAFAVSSLTDSRVILDQPGAEKLVGKGDMLLLSGSSVANRIQGSWVSEDEVHSVVEHWRAQAPEPIVSNEVEGAEPEQRSFTGIDASLDVTSDANAFSAGDDDEDTQIMRQAIELVVRSQLGSTSMLQRKLKVGFARAGRIMDLLEQRGVVGPSEGSKAREVLMSVEEFELLRERGQI